MELIDTHCHLSFKQLQRDIAELIARSEEAGVRYWVTVGTDNLQNKESLELCERFENVYAAVGIHPHYAGDVKESDLKLLAEFAEHEKVVAVGETGFDLYYNYSQAGAQEWVFKEHLKLAARLNLPVVVHCREAFEQTIAILDNFGKGGGKIVFHCFSGDARQARVLIDKGYFVSFTGLVTFKNAGAVREAAEAVPVSRLMVESDCPYMSPEPMRKQKVNEPALLIHTAAKLAELKAVSPETFAEKVTGTSKSFFGIK